MTWLAFAILTAFFESLKDVSSKKSVQTLDVYLVAWIAHAFAFIFLLPVLIITPMPNLDAQFWWALVIGGTLNVIAFTLYIKAIQLADLSITVPLVTLTPLFLLFTSPFILGEYPTLMDAVGIGLIVVGAYGLNFKDRSQGYFQPLKSLFRNRGSRLMLIVAFIWSITSNFDKLGVRHSSPIVWSAALYGYLAIGSFAIALLKSRRQLPQILPNLKPLALIGLFHALGISCQMIAITHTLVSHVIAIKRTSALISVVIGHWLFKERGLQERFLGASTMVLGVVLIMLF